MKKLVSLSFFVTICFYTTFGCTLAGKSLGDFDAKEYIFIGEVVGYTNPIKSPKLRDEATGLIVKIKESIYLPKNPKNYLEVFPIQLWADCSEGGKAIDELKKEFPINSEVRVIAKEAMILPNLTEGNIRLEDRPEELGSITLQTDETKKFMSSRDKTFAYKAFKMLIEDNTEIYSNLPDFEIRKELLRLKMSKSKVEQNEILQTFLDMSICCSDLYRNLSFYSIFKNYSANQSEFNDLWETHLKTTSPDIYEQYKVLNYVESKLTSLGYRKKSIDKALEKAMKEGVDLEKSKLFERCLQILKTSKKKVKIRLKR